MRNLIGVLLICSHMALAASPPLTESARKESLGQPEVVKDNIDDMKLKVLEKKSQSLLFKRLLKTEGFESSLPTVVVSHSNEMSSRYQIYSLTYSIDQDRVYNYYRDTSTNKQPLAKEITVFKGLLPPGNHELTVEVVYKGNDTGVFSYINDFKITSQTTKTFKVDKGQSLNVQVVGYEKGWALTDFKDKPDLKINFRSANSSKELR